MMFIKRLMNVFVFFCGLLWRTDDGRAIYMFVETVKLDKLHTDS